MVVRFYRTASGASPVERYLFGLESRERALVFEAIDAVERYGLDSSHVTMRQLDGRLWELKISAQRVLYVTVNGPVVVLLHGYRKQGQKAPLRELEVARKRMKEVLQYEA